MTISEDHAWEVAKEMDREIERLKAALAEKEAKLAAARDVLRFILEDTGDEFDCPRCHAACRKALKEAE
jgi:hypothetical protein